MPAFLITHVIYAPPGRSSKIAYSETSTVGTTVTNTQSFKREVKVSAELSGGVIFGNTDLQITVGNTWGNSRAEATDLAVETVRGYTANGQTDGIDHNWDEIWFLMQPLVNITYQPAGVDVSQPASARWHLAPNQDGFSNAVLYYAQVGWLNGAMPMPDDVRRTLDAFHITSEYYSDLLSADPLASGGLDPARYDYIGEFPFEPVPAGGQANPQAFMVTQTDGSSTTTTAENTWTTALVDNGRLGIPFVLQVKASGSLAMTWTNSSSTKTSTTNKTSDSLTVGRPSSDYNGPTLLHVYEDRIYKTYAFTLDWKPSCADSCGGPSPAGCWCDDLCAGYGDCCPDKVLFCGP